MDPKDNSAISIERLRQAAAKLREAAEDVDVAMNFLNTGYKMCECCNRRTFLRPDHARIYERHGDVHNKLNDLARRLLESADRIEANNPQQ